MSRECKSLGLNSTGAACRIYARRRVRGRNRRRHDSAVQSFGLAGPKPGLEKYRLLSLIRAPRKAWETSRRPANLTPESVDAHADEFAPVPHLRFEEAAQEKFGE